MIDAVRERSATPAGGARSDFADRVGSVGSATVFAVSAEAAVLAAEGRKIYAFHVGDLDFRTPANIVDAAVKAMRDGRTRYCPSAGIPELREALAIDAGASRGVSYAADNVSVQPGGPFVVAKFLLALMSPGDQVLYPNPGFYYQALIGFLGGEPVAYGFREEADHFTIDFDALERQVTPQTRLLILNDLHNPTASECTPLELQRLADFVLEHQLLVLCDEAYFDVRYEGLSRSLVSLPGMLERCVILYTFSKKYAMTGWRVAAAIGPKRIIEVFNKINVSLEMCTNQIAQWAALEALTGDQEERLQMLATLKERRDVCWKGLAAIDGVHCLLPHATLYLYPRMTDVAARKGFADYESFRRAVLAETGVAICTREHFGTVLPGESDMYLRFAYSSIVSADIAEGLAGLKTFLEG
jgi:aspartate/methionine/tyrosine aminotransferase